MPSTDELIKLSQLHQDGILTQEEFEAEKQKILNVTPTTQKHVPASEVEVTLLKGWDDIPLRWKLWFQLIVSIFLPLIGLLLMVFLPSYSKTEDEKAQKVRNTSKSIYMVAILAAWGLFVLVESVTFPECDSSRVIERLDTLIEKEPLLKFANIKPLWHVVVSETSYDEGAGKRVCKTEMLLENGKDFTIRYELIEEVTEAGAFSINLLYK